MDRSDRILLEGMEFYAFHGRNESEKLLGQTFVVDVVAELDLSAGSCSDNVLDTVSYSDIYRVVEAHMLGSSKNLLETLAESIAGNILDSFPIIGVTVKVKKPTPPIKGKFIGGASVEIYRSKP